MENIWDDNKGGHDRLDDSRGCTLGQEEMLILGLEEMVENRGWMIGV